MLLLPSITIQNIYCDTPCFRMPAYNRSSWFALFFVVYVIVCLYIFMSIVLATIYNNYKKNLKVICFCFLLLEHLNMFLFEIVIRINNACYCFWDDSLCFHYKWDK